jgi:hypothetical protein
MSYLCLKKRNYLGNGNDRLYVVFLDLQPMAEAGAPQEGAGAPLSLLGPLWTAPGHRRSLLGVPGLHSLVFDVPGQLPALPDLELNIEKMKDLKGSGSRGRITIFSHKRTSYR